eukprot:1180361-Prorocentrum_minimum.AAC.1
MSLMYRGGCPGNTLRKVRPQKCTLPCCHHLLDCGGCKFDEDSQAKSRVLLLKDNNRRTWINTASARVCANDTGVLLSMNQLTQHICRLSVCVVDCSAAHSGQVGAARERRRWISRAREEAQQEEELGVLVNRFHGGICTWCL